MNDELKQRLVDRFRIIEKKYKFSPPQDSQAKYFDIPVPLDGVCDFARWNVSDGRFDQLKVFVGKRNPTVVLWGDDFNVDTAYFDHNDISVEIIEL